MRDPEKRKFFRFLFTHYALRITGLMNPNHHVQLLTVGLCLGLFSLLLSVAASRVHAEDFKESRIGEAVEFSARLKWRAGGKTSKAQLFVKGDRYRIEHFGGIRTDLGYASVTIVRLDKQKVWYVLSKRRLVVVVPLTVDFLLPLSIQLEGEVERTLIGDAMVGDRSAKLYEVVVDRNGRRERFYEWVDEERNLLLKLVSQDRDWSVEYERIVQSEQPDYFFETPLGYQKFEVTEQQAESG